MSGASSKNEGVGNYERGAVSRRQSYLEPLGKAAPEYEFIDEQRSTASPSASGVAPKPGAGDNWIPQLLFDFSNIF